MISPIRFWPVRFWKPLLGLGLLLGAVWLVRARQAQVKAAVREGVLEGPARRRSFAELARDLDRAGLRLESRFARAADTPANRQQARHVIGIERWGQSRLRVLAGESAFVPDGHQPYLPAEHLTLPQLREAASLTRAATSEQARQFEKQPPVVDTAQHNDFGPLSARAWLRYLLFHAEFESRRLK